MEHNIDFRKPYKSMLMMLRIIGLYSFTDDFFGLNFYSAYTIIVLLMQNCHYVFRISYWFLVETNFESSIASFILLFEELVANVKAYAMIRYHRNVKELLDQCNDHMYQPKSAIQKTKASETLKLFRVFYVVFSTSAWISLNFNCFNPLLSSGPKHLPLLAWYPFNQTYYFKTAYAHQTISNVYYTLTNLYTDCFSVGLLVYIMAQCDIMSDSIRNLVERVRNTREWKNDDELRHHEEIELRNMILHHKKLLMHFQTVYDFLNMIILWQYVVSTGTLCMTLLQATLIEPNDPVFVTMVFFETAVICQLFLYCWWGSEMIEKSGDLPRALFECDWIETSPRFKKDLIFFMHKVQTPLEVYGADYFLVSLRSFILILRMSYSYYTVMSGMSILKKK